jgi:hypothetical protein
MQPWLYVSTTVLAVSLLFLVTVSSANSSSADVVYESLIDQVRRISSPLTEHIKVELRFVGFEDEIILAVCTAPHIECP